jgi:hypothetical protein
MIRAFEFFQSASTAERNARYSPVSHLPNRKKRSEIMGSLSDESFDEFLDSLKQAGIAISNERELRERLAEAQRWRYAFATLASNGRPLGIRFKDESAGAFPESIHRAFTRFQFPESMEIAFAASLNAEC